MSTHPDSACESNVDGPFARVNRELRALTQCSHAMVRAADEQSLIGEICRIVCEVAGYRMAWVGFAEHDEAKTVRPVSWSGLEDNYVRTARISWGDNERGRGPTGTAIRTRSTCVTQDFETDSRMALWRDAAVQRGYRSNIALPLLADGQAFGALTIYSTQPNYFTQQEVQLLEELASDLGFGISSLRARAAQKKAEADLKITKARAEQYLQIAQVILVAFDDQARVTLINRKGYEVLGYEEGELLGRNWFETCLPQDEREMVLAAYKKIIAGEIEPLEYYENHIVTRTGERRLIAWRNTLVKDADGQVTGTLSSGEDITERKEAEASLFREQLFSRKLLDSLPGLFYLYTYPDLRLVKWNRNHETLLGYTGEELKNFPLVNWHKPEAVDAVRHAVEQVMEKGQAEIESPLLAKDGRQVPFVLTGVKFEALGQLYLMGVGIDITQRKEAEEALKEAEWKFHALFENGPIGVAYHQMIYDDAGNPINYRFLDANRSYLDLTGVDPRGKTVLEAFPGIENDSFDWIGKFGHVARTGISVRFEAYLQYNNRWYDCVGYRYKADHFVVAFLEITKRKEAEQALRESTNKQTKMISKIGDVIVIIDQNGMNRFKSPNVEKWFGWRPEELVGFGTLDNVHPDDLESARKFIDGLLTKPNTTGTIECRYRCKDGSYKWIEFVGTNLLNDPDIRGILGNYHDISERKRAEEERGKLEAQLQHAQRMESVGRLAGGVAHDFNNMIHAILGNVDLVLEDLGPDSPARENLNEIRNCAQRSADLTRQLLSFARRQTVAPKVLNLNDTVEGLIKLIRRLIGENIRLVWQPAANLGLIKVDPTQIDQILANLCVNARDAIQGVGAIMIETENASFDAEYCASLPDFVPGEYVRLSVCDTGSGMNDEVKAHVFEPFFTTKGIGKGTGLGLATVYGIVKQNNGFIHCRSEVGRGTTFDVYLPRHSAEALAPAKEPEVTLPRSGGETLLLVEDEPSILVVTSASLQRMGYNVLAATSPEEALRLADKHSGVIHLLMTDVVMPGMNGKDLAKDLLSTRPHLKCLFMSGYTADVIANHGVLEDGVHFIQKPFTKEDLALKLRSCLET